MQDWPEIRIKEQLRKRYLSLMPVLTKVANQCGYALAIHGSMTRDLDLIAVPWVPKAMAPESLVMMIEEEMNGYQSTRNRWKLLAAKDPKPHGRKAYIIWIAKLADDFENPQLRHAHIDLSVMPRK